MIAGCGKCTDQNMTVCTGVALCIPQRINRQLIHSLRFGCVYQENGLKLSNSWAGYHILLNPDYSAQILWRFVNRAIDEVENCQVTCNTALKICSAGAVCPELMSGPQK